MLPEMAMAAPPVKVMALVFDAGWTMTVPARSPAVVGLSVAEEPPLKLTLPPSKTRVTPWPVMVVDELTERPGAPIRYTPGENVRRPPPLTLIPPE